MEIANRFWDGIPVHMCESRRTYCYTVPRNEPADMASYRHMIQIVRLSMKEQRILPTMFELEIECYRRMNAHEAPFDIPKSDITPSDTFHTMSKN